MRSYINSTREASGLTKVVEKMMTDKKIDIVYQISKNAEQMKELTLESIQIGLTTDLFLIDEKMNIETQNIKIPKLSKKTEDILKISEKIGVWFSKLNVLEIEKILKVRF